MGASYSWAFLWETYTAFRLAWPRATEVVLTVFGITPADVLKSWKNDEKNWIRFKRMVHITEQTLAITGLDHYKVEDFGILMGRLAEIWVKKGLVSQKRYLDILAKKEESFRAPMKEGGQSELASDGRQLYMVF